MITGLIFGFVVTWLFIRIVRGGKRRQRRQAYRNGYEAGFREAETSARLSEEDLRREYEREYDEAFLTEVGIDPSSYRDRI